MEIQYYVDVNGNYLGGFGGVDVPDGSVLVPSPPADARQHWNGTSWDDLTIPQFKIYDLIDGAYDRERLPVDIDFKTGLNTALYQETIMDHGSPVYKQYYTSAVSNDDGSVTYSNPIVRIDYTFDRDSLSLAKSCTQRFRWYDTTGTLSTDYKDVKDFFNSVESMAESVQRRSNIIDDLKVKTIGLLMITQQISEADAAALGRIFLAAYKVEIYNYIDEADTDFAAAVAAAPANTYPWLDSMTPYGVTIRQFIVGGLS